MRERPRISGRDAVSHRHRVPTIIVSRGGGEEQAEGKKQKQEKGNASQALLSYCLHIVFYETCRAARETCS